VSGPWEDFQSGPWEDFKKPREPAPTAERLDPLVAGAMAAGRWADRMAAGARALTPAPLRAGIDRLNSALGMGAPPSIDPAVQADHTKRFESVEKENPTSTFVGDLIPRAIGKTPLGMALSAGVEYGTPTERMTRAGLTYGFGKAGEWGAGKLAEKSGQRAAERASIPPAPSAQDETVRELMAAGLKLPPDQINPSPVNRVLTGLAGKANTQQGMAIANEPKLVAIAKQELGIPESAELTKGTIAGVRNQASGVYTELKKFGTFKADAEYAPALQGLTQEYRALAAEYPEMANTTIDALVKMVSRPEFKSAPTVDLVKRLRYDARANFKAFDNPEKKALAQVQRGIADALEDLMDRNLAAAGQAGFLEKFRAARTLIAKTHTVEDALEESTGKIVASKVKGYTTGGLRTIQKAHEAFPKSVQNINTPMPGINPLDFLAGLVGGQAGGVGMGLGIPLVRPLTRAGITSDAYQKGLMGGGKSADLFELMARDPEKMKRLGGLLGLGAQGLGQ
jgi:hypothetical protein